MRDLMRSEHVTCPKCAATEGERCRTVATRRVTDTHGARIKAFWAEVDRRRTDARRQRVGK